MTEVVIKPTAKLPKGDANGLLDVARELTRDRKKVRVGLVLFDVEDVTSKTDDDVDHAKIRMRRIEILLDPADASATERILMRAFERRNGNTVLPLELEEDVERAFEGINPDKPDGGNPKGPDQ